MTAIRATDEWGGRRVTPAPRPPLRDSPHPGRGRGTVGDRVLSRRRVLMLAFVVSGLLLGLVPLLLR
jgi:hypothetical protein